MGQDRRNGTNIALLSFLVLALELSLIRFIPAEIKAISYFTNLLLFSSFFGLGLGCILYRKRDLSFLFPVGLFLMALFVYFSRGIVIYQTGDQVHYWLQTTDRQFKPYFQMPLALAAIATFALSSIPFIALGQALALAMDRLTRLKAYSWDIAGSLSGTILFSAISFLGVPPWLLICLLCFLWMAATARTLVSRLNCAFAGMIFLIFCQAAHQWIWSPYYFVQYQPDPSTLTVWVNSSFHQEAIHFATTDPKYKPVADSMAAKFSTPYETYRRYHGGKGPAKVLILGAGSGNDVNIARMNGAEDITAVEIDPAILDLGRQYNWLKPYAQPNVRTVVDDGRHFLWNTREKYDMVVFGTLDSQTLLCGQSNIRLENYIYTAQCFKDVHRVLNDGGMLAAYYSVFKPWFLGRIYQTVREGFAGHQQLMINKNDQYLFNTIIMAGKNLPGFDSDPNNDAYFSNQVSCTDDWPYIYLEYPTIAPLYLYVMATILMLILGAFWILRRVEHAESSHLDLFFLGLGFTLLESAAVVRLALVFGTTWIVTAVVFAGVLLMIFLSNLFVMRFRNYRLMVSWIGLFAAILVNFFFPTEILFGIPAYARVLAACLLIGAPVFFAGTCFSTLFSRQKSTGYALGINLIGAMAGGLLEYFSMLTGMKSIWLLILVVYLLSCLASHKKSATPSAAPADPSEIPATP